MKCIFIYDSFQRGGLEKSCIQLSHLVSRSGFSVVIWSLSSSRPFIDAIKSSLPCNIEVRYFINRFSLYYYYSILPSASLCLTFKNHLPFIVLNALFRQSSYHIVRHSNTILFDIIRSNYAHQNPPSFASSVLFAVRRASSFIRLFIVTSIYTLNQLHLCNSIENKMLLQSFLNRKVFCYVNPEILSPGGFGLVSKSSPTRIRLIWASRYCPSKDITSLVESMHSLQSAFDSNTYFLDVYTTKPDLIFSDFVSAGLPLKSFAVHSWFEYVKSPSDIYIHTAYHEGLSNSFMEQFFHSRRVVCPLTTSGLFKFASLSEDDFLL